MTAKALSLQQQKKGIRREDSGCDGYGELSFSLLGAQKAALELSSTTAKDSNDSQRRT